MNRIKIIESHSEIGAGTRGASLGIQAIKMASLNLENNYFSDISTIEVPNENDLLFKSTDTEYAKRIEGVIKVYKNLSLIVNDTFEEGKFPLVLAGDHSSAGGTITGIKKAFPNKKLGVIWIDAHADLHSPFTSPSGNIHGMPLAVSLGEDNLEMQKNSPDAKTKKLWNELKNVSTVSPKIDPKDLVFIGVRDTEKEEDFLIEKNGIKNISVTKTRIQGVIETVTEVNAHLEQCDLIYISFDVDSMDPTYISRGTGTPVPVGFSEFEATQLVELLLTNEKICCFEITEVNPILDEKCNAMAETAFRILDRATWVINNKMKQED